MMLASVLLLLASNFLAARILFRKVPKKKDWSDQEVEEILSEVIMNLQMGRSFDNSWCDLVAERGLETLNRGRNGVLARECLLVFDQCRKKPAQSLKVLSSFRDIQRLKARVKKKLQSSSVQAKAQVIVSFVLYLALFAFQMIANPEFGVFFKTPYGRGLIFFSFLLLITGGFLVFRLAQPREFHL